MRTSPTIAPHGPDHDTYLVLEDFDRLGRVWRETDEDCADRETLVAVQQKLAPKLGGKAMMLISAESS